MKNKIQQYVCGFMFCFETNEIALIEKNRPEFAAGKINGIGGKVEPGEQPKDAIVREFEEETGVKTYDWIYLINLNGTSFNGPGFECSFYYNNCSERTFAQIHTTTDEKVRKVTFHQLFTDPKLPVMQNLRWLVEMALYLNDTPNETISFI